MPAPRSSRLARGLLASLLVLGALAGGARLAAPSMEERIAADDAARASADPLRDRGPEVLALALSPEGDEIIVGGMAPVLLRFDAATGAPLGEVRSEEGWVHGLVWAPDGGSFASLSVSGRLVLRDGPTGEPLYASTPGAEALSVAFHPARAIAAWGGADGSVQYVNLSRRRNGGRIVGLGGPVVALAWSPDGDHVAAGTADGVIALADADDGTIEHTRSGHPGGVSALAFAPGHDLLFSAGFDAQLKVWSFADGLEPLSARGAHDGRIFSAALLADAQQLVTVGTDPRARSWSFAGTVRPLRGHSGWIRAVSAALDGSRLATGDSHGRVVLWRAPDLGPERRIELGERLSRWP